MLVIDGFLSDPDGVRAFALKQDFKVVHGNSLGRCTRAFASPEIKTVLETLVGRRIVGWLDQGFNGAYQYATSDSSRPGVHHAATEYVAVLFLAPNAPLESGVTFYHHRRAQASTATPDTEKMMDDDARKCSQWTPTDVVENVYNRLLVFRGQYKHAASEHYFGKGLADGRLIQTFFFDTF